MRPARGDVPAAIEPAVLADLDAMPLPTAPVVPLRRMRPRPHRHRDHARLPLAVPLLPEHDDQAARSACRRSRRSSQAALEAYRNTGYNEISLLGALDERLSAHRRAVAPAARGVPPAGREHLAAQPADQRAAGDRWAILLNTDRRDGLTLAPEVARDDMREQIGKQITNEDLYDGCRRGDGERLSRG